MPEKLRDCPLCEKPGIGPYPTGETASLPGALFYATTTCDHLHVEGMTEEEVVREFNRHPREERLEALLRQARQIIQDEALVVQSDKEELVLAAIDAALAPEGERKEGSDVRSGPQRAT